ncbi:hypothetical protein [Bacteroides heparinolyticus]|uniref:hypothetical protein n=1 Tax=Prevotella heparinolytica TaxID=28113 RepID=UPI0035A0480C
MIYPVLTDFEWAIAGFMSVAIIVAFARAMKREARKCAPKEPTGFEKAEASRRTEQILSEVEAEINRVKAQYEEATGLKWDD